MRLWRRGCGIWHADSLSKFNAVSAYSLKRIYLFLIAISCGASRLVAQYTPIPTLQAPVAGFSFPVKETLSFDVDWRVFTAGTAVFHLEQVPGGQLKISATADTAGATNMLFPVVDKFQAGLDTKTGCSTGFSKQLQEGPRKVNSDLNFDYNTGKADAV